MCIRDRTLSFHENVNEDEIAFIALHVGTEIERQKKEETKVSCLLLCPEYLNITSTLHKKIMMDFGDQLTIQKSISFENEIQMCIRDRHHPIKSFLSSFSTSYLLL